MSKVTSYAPGTPCWVDLASADLEASARFYSDLLGWDASEGPNSAELGGYRRATYAGDEVAGIYPLMAEGQPPVWTTHISTDDIEAAATRVTENGGGVISEPMDVMGMLRFGVFTDSTGAVFGIAQPGTFIGAERVNGAGALCWNELNTRDPEAAKDFYGAVFGWTYEEHKMQRDLGGSGPDVYVEWQLDGNSIGGMTNISGMMPDEVPAHWLVYFGVDDTDAAIEKVKSAGGAVELGPIDIDAGRFAVVSEPNAPTTTFAVIRPAD